MEPTAKHDKKWSMAMEHECEMKWKWNMTVKWNESGVRWNETVKWNEFVDYELQMNVVLCHYLLQKGNGKYRMSDFSDFHPAFSV